MDDDGVGDSGTALMGKPDAKKLGRTWAMKNVIPFWRLRLGRIGF